MLDRRSETGRDGEHAMSNTGARSATSSARTWYRLEAVITAGLLLFAALMVVLDPGFAPIMILVRSRAPSRFGTRGGSARGTALRPALLWAVLAIGLAGVAQIVAL